MHDLLVFTGWGQRFEERQVVVTQAAGGQSRKGENTEERSRNTENTRQTKSHRSPTDGGRQLEELNIFQMQIVGNGSEALAARQSSQFKRS